MQAAQTAAVLDGSKEFTGLMWDPDTWMEWFTYQLPDDTQPQDAAARIARRIQSHNACFVLRREERYESDLRCSEPRGPFFREYRIIVTPARHSVYIMYASIDSEAELEGYPRAVRDFERASNLHERW